MKKINFNSDWQFIFEKNLESHNTYGFDKYMEATGAATQFYDFSNWNKITLPHDFAVALPDAGLRRIRGHGRFSCTGQILP